MIDTSILSRDLLLQVVFDVRARSDVVVTSIECIIGQKEHENGSPDYAAPVHLAWRRAWSTREELEKPEHHEEAQRNDINRVACFAKIKSRSRELFAAESFLKDT